MLYSCRSLWLQGSLKRNDQTDHVKPRLAVQCSSEHRLWQPRGWVKRWWAVSGLKSTLHMQKGFCTRAEIKILNLSSM